MQHFLQQEAVQTIPWPAMSPDMNPIEHVWDFIGCKSNQRNPILQVNYDQGIKYGRDYTVKSYFTSPNGTQGNYFSIIKIDI